MRATTRTPFGFFAWVLCSGLLFLQGCNGAYVAEAPSTNIEEVGPSWDEIAAQVPLGPGRRYSDEELGLHDLIDQVVFYRPYFARGRTIDEFMDPRNERYDYIHDGDSKHRRERLRFEFDIEAAQLYARDSLPADLGEDGPLEDAYFRWMTDCVAEAGFPDVVVDPDTGNELPIYEAEDEQLVFYESETGFTRDRFYDLRYECAQQAVSYPYLDPDERDAMIGRLKKHYLQAAYDYIRRNDEEVPIEEPVDYSGPGGEPDPAPVDPRELTRAGFYRHRETRQHLSGYKFLRDAGVLEYIEKHVIDVPPAASFIPYIELNMMLGGVLQDLATADSTGEPTYRFELTMLDGALHEGVLAAWNELRFAPSVPELGPLDEAFFDALEACGRDAVGPDMKLFVIRDGLGSDPNYDGIIVHDGGPGDYISGLSYYEYLELLHECTRQAAAYPTLDPAARDELLAPQRAHFAAAVLEYLDNQTPPVEIPERYRADIEELRRDGW